MPKVDWFWLVIFFRWQIYSEAYPFLTDALHYANVTYRPKTIIDVATLTGAMGISLGHIFSGVFTVCQCLHLGLED